MLLLVWVVPYGHPIFIFLDSFECLKDQQRQTRPVWSRNDQTECQNVLKRGKILSQNDPIGSQKGPVGFHNCQIAKMARGWWYYFLSTGAYYKQDPHPSIFSSHSAVDCRIKGGNISVKLLSTGTCRAAANTVIIIIIIILQICN